MVRALLLDATKDVGGGLGEYEFLHLPAQGDRVTLPEPWTGEIGYYDVVRVEHRPVAVKRSPIERSDPGVCLYIKWVRNWTPPN